MTMQEWCTSTNESSKDFMDHKAVSHVWQLLEPFLLGGAHWAVSAPYVFTHEDKLNE